VTWSVGRDDTWILTASLVGLLTALLVSRLLIGYLLRFGGPRCCGRAGAK
jgi:hypothetical protein